MHNKGNKKMKKLMILIGAVVAASMVNAASFNWRLQTGADYSGMNIYALTGTSAASVLSACQSTEAATWASTFSGFTSVKATGTDARAGADGLSTGISAGDKLVFVIVDGDVADGSKYWVVNDYAIPSANVFEPPAAGTKATITLSAQGTAGSGTFTAVPEPTSALLLLLGMAGLALKRKHC